MTRRNRNTFTMPFEIEHGSSAVEYEAVFKVCPGEPERGPSYSSGGEPGCPPSIEWCEVWYVITGKGGTQLRERRPELDEIVDEDELLEHAGEQDDGGRDWDNERKSRLENRE